MKIDIGKDNHGKWAAFDLSRLLASRLLIQATSGAGKSWMIRRIVEQVANHIQVILLDPEGEFSTLREQFDMVLVGTGAAEVPADPKTATVLARRLMELRTSAIIDLYEFDRAQRAMYVRDFLNSLLQIPKQLYHPTLVVIDEAHSLCPQDSDSVAASAVIGIMDRGRKRGIAGILATQRLSKLDKDAAAECGNILIGRTSAIDVKRAADLLGVPQNERHGFTRLEDGEWLAVGPAMAGEPDESGIFRFRCGETATKPPRPGHKLTTPAASKAIQKVLPELADLARKDDADPLTLDEANASIVKLRQEIAKARMVAAQRQVAAPDQASIDRAVKVATAPYIKTIDAINLANKRQATRVTTELKKMREMLSRASSGAADLIQSMGELPEAVAPIIPPPPRTFMLNEQHETHHRKREPYIKPSGEMAATPKGERAILVAAASRPDGVTREALTVLTGYKRSSRDTYIQRLREKGYIDGGDQIVATPAGIESLGSSYEPLPTGAALWEWHKTRLPEGERKMVEVAMREYPRWLSRERVSELLPEYKRSSRDTYIQRASVRKLIETGSDGIRASAELFDQ